MTQLSLSAAKQKLYGNKRKRRAKMEGLIKDIELAREARQNRDDEKHAGGFWDLSLDIAESENPQELIYNYLVAFNELLERAKYAN